jgi:hypothetical protein
MNCFRIGIGVAVLSLPVAVFAQAAMQPSGPASEAAGAYNRIKPNILKAADKMPADAYSYKPTPEVRTFARVVNHITEAQMRVCSAMNGGSFDPKTLPGETADKDAVLTALKVSFAECDKAYGALTDGGLMEVVTLGPMGKRSRVGAAWGNVSHDSEQYATLALYLRLKGLVPPSSEK